MHALCASAYRLLYCCLLSCFKQVAPARVLRRLCSVLLVEHVSSASTAATRVVCGVV